MFMIVLTTFFGLSFIDAYITIVAASVDGYKDEQNPILRKMLRKSNSLFLKIKAVITILFILLNFIIYIFFPTYTSLSLLIIGFFIILYILIIYHNIKILKEIKSQNS